MATAQQLSESPATQQQDLAQLALTGALLVAIQRLWDAANPMQGGAQQFRHSLYALMQALSGAASSIATDYYQAARAEAGVTQGLPAAAIRPVDPPPRALVDAGVDYALRTKEEALKRLEAQLTATLPDIERQMATQMVELEAAAKKRVEASMQKALADIAREQVVRSAQGDEYAMGFRRVPRPGACYFCIVMAIRESTRTRQKAHGKFVHGDVKHLGVYKTRESAGARANDLFEGDGHAKFHNNCHCVIEPVFFEGLHAPASWLGEMRDLYDNYDLEKYGTGLLGFRRALDDFRKGVHTGPPVTPIPALPAANPAQVAALLDLLPQVA